MGGLLWLEGGFTKIKNNLKTNPNTHTTPQHATATCVNSQEIIAQRRRAGLQTKMQKDEMMNILESSRANGGRAIKMLQTALQADQNKNTGGGGKKKKKRADRNQEGDANGIGGTTGYANTAESLGPAPDGKFSHLERMNQTEGGGEPMPYTSPYEEQMGGEKGAETVTF